MKGIRNFNYKQIKTAEDLKSFCNTINQDDKDRVIDFFGKLEPSAYTSSYVYDVVLEKQTDIPIVGYILEDYAIDSRDIYYFKNYDLKLNDDFIEYVLSQ